MTLPDWAIHALGPPPEASDTARRVDALHAAVISTAFAGIGIVAIVTLYFVVRYRRRGPGEITPRVVASGRREWTTAALVLGLFISFWLVGYAQYLDIERPPDHAALVYVTAKQWMWKFGYPNGHASTDTLFVRERTPVHLVMTSRDVIHSFYAPGFRIKQDVLPGRWVSAWLDAAPAGSYPIYCAELCGVSHSRMRGEVRVLDAADYERWWHDGRDQDDMVLRGKSVAAQSGCLSCHTIDGQRHIGPSFAGLYRSTVTLDDGRTVLADEAYLTRSMMEPLADRVAGFNPVMPAYRNVLSAEEVGALVEMIRSLDHPAPPRVTLPSLEVTKLDGGTP
ncbi:MAG TPA: cytochrome c oxidase subunit II [Polyangiaceae bacterium]